MYRDKIFICRDCGGEFIFTAGEQEFYAERGFRSEPRRCKFCRARKKSGGRQRRDITLYEIVCAKCGAVEEVLFKPERDRPIYCSRCYREMNERR